MLREQISLPQRLPLSRSRGSAPPLWRPRRENDSPCTPQGLVGLCPCRRRSRTSPCGRGRRIVSAPLNSSVFRVALSCRSVLANGIRLWTGLPLRLFGRFPARLRFPESETSGAYSGILIVVERERSPTRMTQEKRGFLWQRSLMTLLLISLRIWIS